MLSQPPAVPFIFQCNMSNGLQCLIIYLGHLLISHSWTHTHKCSNKNIINLQINHLEPFNLAFTYLVFGEYIVQHIHKHKWVCGTVCSVLCTVLCVRGGIHSVSIVKRHEIMLPHWTISHRKCYTNTGKFTHTHSAHNTVWKKGIENNTPAHV